MKPFIVLTIIMCITFSAQALTFIGPPIEGGSWAQRFYEDTGTGYDFMRIDLKWGPDFNIPPLTNFSYGDWERTEWWSEKFAEGASGQEVIPSTNQGNTMQFDVKFSGDKSDPFAFYFSSWSGSDLNNLALATWTGSGWQFDNDLNLDQVDLPYSFGSNPRTPPVPEPANLILMAVGVGAIAMVRRLRRG